MDRKTLYIYRASAGSGKTFTLAIEYIKLLIANPEIYKRILAVTFTNKATAEMKERILSQLYGIANALPSSESYMNNLRTALKEFSDEEIRRRAGMAMKLILHDYSHFRIHTIDAFFQTILRGLAKELELNGDMEITLDGEQLLDDAVDLLIKKLTPTSNEMAWLVEYIEEHIANNKSWRVRKAIKDFAGNILKEEYQERGEELRQQIEENKGVRLAEYRKTLRKIEKDIITRTKELGAQFFEIAETNGLSMDDFQYKKNGVWGHFEKLRNGTLVAPGTRTKGYLKNPNKISDRLTTSQCEKIASLIAENVDMAEKELPILNNCSLSLARFHQLRLLNSISKTLQEENTRGNRFLLAQTTYLLSRMIEKNTAFIFEKTGSEISHIFIDEFQDTSKLQWKCFKVLLEEVMAHRTFNLIVGDVKQSIYRWRNSDWNILNRIEEEFHSETIGNYLTTLQKNGNTTNYRSERRIVEFNNALFKRAVEIIDENYKENLGNRLEDLKKAYDDVTQIIPQNKKNEGYAEIRLLDGKENGFEEAAYEQLINTLQKLLKTDNVKPSDICILVRTKKYAQEIARRFNEHFANEKFSIVSDEAYRLSSSMVLKLIMAALKYIATPDDDINTVNLIATYNILAKNENFSFDSLINEGDFKKYIPKKIVDELPELSRLPIYELLERLIMLLGIDKMKGEEAFIYSFLDHASIQLSHGISDICSFVKIWEEELKDKSIPAGDTDSVKIMTIHKSKGLEFHTVIIPFATWKLTGDTRNIIWCKPNEEPFSNLSLLPINCSSKMLESIYAEDYNREYLFQLVDNLNLLYVACTRAAKNLFIFTETDSKKDKMGALFTALIGSLPLEGCKLENEQKLLTYGEIVSSKDDKTKKNDNPFEKKPQNKNQPFCSHENRLTFKQSRNLARFLTKEKEEEERLEYIAQGELLHDLLSKLKTGEELERNMMRLQMEGLIGGGKEYENIKRIITRALAHPMAADWFGGRYKLFNECTILYKEENTHEQRRPDRVMTDDEKAIVVDFKFGREKDEYHQQVREYISLLQKMDYKNVKGYIWYVYTNHIVEVL